MPSCRDRENFSFFTYLMHVFGFRSVAAENVETVAALIEHCSLHLYGESERTDSSCGESEGEGENR